MNIAEIDRYIEKYMKFTGKEKKLKADNPDAQSPNNNSLDSKPLKSNFDSDQ